MTAPVDQTSTTLGHTIYDNLGENSNVSRFGDAQMAAGNRMASLEDEFADASSKTEAELADWSVAHGYTKKGTDGTAPKVPLQSILARIQSKMDTANQTFMSLQKMRDKTVDTMMEIIKAIGR